jgi:hypothetical protein
VGTIGEFAKFMAADSEVPEEFYFAAGLTFLGHVCGANIRLANSLDVRPQLYTVLLGDSGEVKKSTAMRKTREFFESLGLDNLPQLSLGVGSAEGLAKNLSSHQDLLLAYDELRSFIDKCGVQTSVLLPMVTSLYEQTGYQNTTKSSNVVVNDAHLSLLGCCTSDTYADMWTPAAISIGLPNRLFVVKGDARSRVAWPKPKPEAEMARLRDLVKSQVPTGPTDFSISPEGSELWTRWYESRPRSVHATRLDTIGFRLMGLLAVTMDKGEIDSAVVSVVTKILDYEYRVRVATDPINADNKIAGLEQKIRNALSLNRNCWVPERELRQKTHADRTGLFYFNCALKNLATISGEIESKKERGKLLYRLAHEDEDVAVSSPVASPSINVNIHMIQ